MRRLYLFLLLTAIAALRSAAQQFIVFETQDGRTVVDADDVESITLERDDAFYARLLPEAIAADPATTLFGEALRRTGLADSLRAFADESYPVMDESERRRMYENGSPTSNFRIPEVRRRSYTAFVESDAVFAVHGIRSLADLEAYAREVYDEAFPEDAAVSDPTDRRHPLNRFVAYHLLPFGSTFDELTPNPVFYYRDQTDACDWYQTLLPCASLKCARPRSDNGIYINRRGISDGPDRYGVQVRGTRIVPGTGGELTQAAANGAYYYIDDLLTYDLQTQRVALNERWRFTATSLSPDFMTQGIRAVSEKDVRTTPNHVFLNDKVENFRTSTPAETFVYYPLRYMWQWDAEVDFAPDGGRSLRGSCDLTLALPALPEGDYELRFGHCAMVSSPRVRFSVDGVVLADSVDFCNWEDKAFAERTGWQPYTTDSAEVRVRREMRSRGWMRGPRERALPNNTLTIEDDYEPSAANSYPMSYAARNCRAIVGRFHSDGRRASTLRIESLPYTYKEYYSLIGGGYGGTVDDAPLSFPVRLDYLELCPVWIADNEVIPEY